MINIYVDHSSSLFRKLTQQSKDALVETADSLRRSDTPRTRDELESLFHENSALMRHVCQKGLRDVLVDLLDVGANPNLVRRVDQPTPRGTLMTDQSIIPLCHLRMDNPNALAMVDLLISRGADPNFVHGTRKRQLADYCPMHESTHHPEMLSALIGHGGSVNSKDENGFSVGEHWLWLAHSPPKGKMEPLVASLKIMINSGWNHAEPMVDGGSFLTQCWASPQTRRHIPALIALGLDPCLRGSAKGANGNSLEQHLEKKVKSGKVNALAGDILSHIQASRLDDETATASWTRSAPRL